MSEAQSKVLEGEILERASVPWFHSDADALAFVERKGVNGFTEMEEALLLGMGGGPTKAGVDVGAEVALRVSAAFACRRVISEDIGKMPRRVVQQTRDGAGNVAIKVAHDHPVHKLLVNGPNDWMPASAFIEYLVGVATFHRGAYAIVNRDAQGNVVEILPLPAGCGAVEVDGYWQPRYRVTGYGLNLLLEPDQVLRLHGPLHDPWEGLSTVTLAREAIGLAIAIEASQARFHANDLRPSGVLTTEEAISPEVRDTIRNAWKQAYGASGDGGIAVLDKKFAFQTITAEAAKAEVIENRKFQISEICRFFRVIPGMIGHNDGSQSFASIEAQFEAHKTHTLQPWVVRAEEALTLGLLTRAEREDGYRVDVDMDAFLRGTPNERMNYYEKAIKNGLMTPNEARIAEGRAPLAYPQMDMPQLQANNTGIAPAAPAAAPGAPPPASTTVPPVRIPAGF